MTPFLRPLAMALLCALLPIAAPAAERFNVTPALPRIPSHVINLKDYGANPDGTTDNAGAIRRALAALKDAGGGTLVVPAGTYFTGPFDIGSRTELRLEAGATLQFTTDFAAYKGDGPKGYRPLIRISESDDVLISGQGTINGGGSAWWPEALRFKAAANARHASSNTSPRPVMVAFTRCRRIAVTGVTLTNSPVFNLVQNRCQDVTVDGINIKNPWNSPNTDGVDPKDCQRVLITRCTIDTGDDCIALGGSSGLQEKDILVENCTFRHGHGCSIGSGTQSGVTDMVVRHCTFDGTETGVRFKSARGRGGVVERVVYEDLQMRNVGVAISISSYYDNTPIDRTLGKETAQELTDTTPVWRHLTVRNIDAQACRVRAGLIAGLPEAPAENIVLENVRIEAPKGLTIGNAKNVTLKGVAITAAEGPDVIAGPTVQDLHRE